MLAAYTSHLESSRIKHYCSIDTINYILSDFDAKCSEAETVFDAGVAIDRLTADLNMFLPILSNALHSQKKLPKGSRSVSLVLKTAGGKLLLSVENPVAKPPEFEDGLPVSTREGEGHGYGTKSIRYMTEQLGGKLQFSVKDNIFSLKVIV